MRPSLQDLVRLGASSPFLLPLAMQRWERVFIEKNRDWIRSGDLRAIVQRIDCVTSAMLGRASHGHTFEYPSLCFSFFFQLVTSAACSYCAGDERAIDEAALLDHTASTEPCFTLPASFFLPLVFNQASAAAATGVYACHLLSSFLLAGFPFCAIPTEFVFASSQLSQ